MKPLVLACVLALALGVAACGSGDDEPKTRTVSEPSGTIEVKKGDRLALAFEQNPGIGWNWLLAGEQPRGVVTRRGVENRNDNPGMAGGSTTKTFLFEAEKAGRTVLRFERDYRGEKIDKRRTVTVEVR